MCNCTEYECLSIVQQYACADIVTLRLAAPTTGTYAWEYEFNGRWNGGYIDVTQGENIVLPYVFNESYVHEIKFYYGDGELVNETCYKLDTSKIAGSYTNNDAPQENGINITVEDESGEGTTTVTDDSINGRTILLVADGNQIYNSSGFTQSPGSNTFVMTNGAVFTDGQELTLIFA